MSSCEEETEKETKSEPSPQASAIGQEIEPTREIVYEQETETRASEESGARTVKWKGARGERERAEEKEQLGRLERREAMKAKERRVRRDDRGSVNIFLTTEEGILSRETEKITD